MNVVARLPRLILGTSMAIAVGVVGAVAMTAAAKPVAAHASTPGGTISRSEVLSRAQTWVDRGIFYTSGAFTNGPDGGSYQEDCSGFVSMSLHLSSSMDTTQLPAVLTQITKDQLQPGDLLGVLGPGTSGAAGHVLIFAGWADTGHTKYNAYENSGGRYVHYSSGADAIPYPYWSPDPGVYLPYRYNNIAAGSVVHETVGSTGWSDGTLPTAAASSVSAVIDNGLRRVYTAENGQLHEVDALPTGWSDLPIGGGAITSVSAVLNSGTRYVYTVQSGQVHEWVATNTGWSDGVLPVAGASAVSAVIDNGMRRVYTVRGGGLYETSALPGGWSDGQILGGTFGAISAVMDGTVRRVYSA